MASIGVLDMRKAMAKTTLTITVETKHKRWMEFRARVGAILLRFVAKIIGVKFITMDWDN